MWRGWDFEDLKTENRINILKKKIAPINYYDILSIVEHPAFEKFYEELLDGNFWTDEGEDGTSWEWGNILGDMVSVELKENYEEYDIQWPIIINDIDEVLKSPEYSLDSLSSFPIAFEELKKMVPQNEVFISQTLGSGTTFGDYDVTMGIFSAKSYNEFLQKLVARVTKYTNVQNITKKGFGSVYPTMQIDLPKLTGIIDQYLKERLFQKSINYLEENNWKVLMI